MFKSIRDFDVEGKRVLVRCDFDVPIANGIILDDFRIKESLSTITYLLDNKAKVILMGHMARPNGSVVESLRLTPIQKKLEEYLGVQVKKASDCIGEEVENLVNAMEVGQVLLLENLRFHKEEMSNSPEFAQALAKLGDLYVNNAFANSHRNHASMTTICKYLPSAAGLTLQKEIEMLEKIMQNPVRPLVAIIGGAKIETKVKFIEEFSEIADFVIVGGLIEKEILEKNIKFTFREKIIAPASNLDALDIDDVTIKQFREKILVAKTIFWNGPFGKFEDEEHKKGSLAIARAIVESGAFSVAGGDETVEFLEREKLVSQFSYVCTGGGSMLAYLAGDILPGLKALE
ncbi:MAG: hypothetical protein A2904_02050 [Candidatus Staskawiczbacteria bacterium RIFCSPLOWO2_01_FULL_33_9]|uniref:Phosphoglycerate kinase n=1 Tax=Candidatus Staskawiczbacteria bacterium RIFCSPLOWO2_01_FULL_33_9 TaxID=1802211 RepID=A0A1G2IAT2_9BACT|nr:MAG: hypothetical protein A2904_02050 [Candidatus Staskawiczbacteria bacterium RIFCSPLOWO2_01_FULL_33_9]